MNFLERLRDVHARIDRRLQVRRAYQDANAFRERAGALRPRREVVATELAKVRVLRARGVPAATLPSPAATRTALAEYRATLSGNPPRNGREYSRLTRSLDKLAKDLRAITDNAIASVERGLTSLDEAFLGMMERMPGQAALVADIRQQRDALPGGPDRRVSPAALEQFLNAWAALETRVGALNLRPDECPGEVIEFFKAVGHGGVPLENFTPALHQWLSARGLLARVRVTLVAG